MECKVKSIFCGIDRETSAFSKQKVTASYHFSSSSVCFYLTHFFHNGLFTPEGKCGSLVNCFYQDKFSKHWF